MAVNLSVEPAASPHSPNSPHGPRTLPALRLRPWQPGDLADLLAAHRDPEIRRWATAPLDDEPAAARWLETQQEEWAAGSRYSFAILASGEGAAAGQLVGGIGVKGIEPDEPSAEVGYWVCAERRGEGIAPRALEAVSQWALDPELPHGPGLERLDLLHSVDNRPSCTVAEKTGYALRTLLAPQPPQFPAEGHLHARTAA